MKFLSGLGIWYVYAARNMVLFLTSAAVIQQSFTFLPQKEEDLLSYKNIPLFQFISA
jgi:hypothetical protein